MARQALFTAALLALPMPCVGQMRDACADLWFTEQLVRHNAGQCPTDVRAATLFGVEQCLHAGPMLSHADAALVALTGRRAEARGCAAEPDLVSLRGQQLAMRLLIEDQPVASVSVRGCLYWTGEPVWLYSGPRLGARVLSSAEFGDDIFWEYESPDPTAGWAFLTVYLDGQQTGVGWAEVPIDDAFCDQVVE